MLTDTAWNFSDSGVVLGIEKHFALLICNPVFRY